MAVDYDAIFGVEVYDPCVALIALRPAYMRMLATGSVQKISFRDRETWFHPHDTKELGNLISRLETECAAKSGRVTHSAITLGGGRRRCRGF